MIKTCVMCPKLYETTGKRITCSQRCAGVLAGQHRTKRTKLVLDNTRTGRMSSSHPNVSNVPRTDLPPVETLPAAYVKRVHDLWESLISDAPTRIA